MFWVYENWTNTFTTVQRAECAASATRVEESKGQAARLEAASGTVRAPPLPQHSVSPRDSPVRTQLFSALGVHVGGRTTPKLTGGCDRGPRRHDSEKIPWHNGRRAIGARRQSVLRCAAFDVKVGRQPTDSQDVLGPDLLIVAVLVGIVLGIRSLYAHDRQLADAVGHPRMSGLWALLILGSVPGWIALGAVFVNRRQVMRAKQEMRSESVQREASDPAQPSPDARMTTTRTAVPAKNYFERS